MNTSPGNSEQGDGTGVSTRSVAGTGMPASGMLWRDVYQIGEQLPDVTHGVTFHAVHVETKHEVLVRTFKVTSTGARGRIWSILKSLRGAGLVELVEGFEVDGRRHEVTAMPPSMTLAQWLAGRKASLTEVEMVLRQLVRTLGELHKAGMVHLNLRPDTVFIKTTTAGVEVHVGGLETAASYQQSELVPMSVNPFYAPPEASGLYQHVPGRGLCAWDWWTVGRLVQEMTLGRHVLGHILNRDVSKHTPELLARAENLIGEHKETDPRAGAVETMPTMDSRLGNLLRGLLSSCRDARWGRSEVERWLEKESVKERYQLNKHDRLFIWQEKPYTVAEAAELFSTAENWEAGRRNIFDQTDPHSLVNFIGAVAALGKINEQLGVVLKLNEADALKNVLPSVRQDVVACVAWGLLAAGTVPIRLHGRRLAESLIEDLLGGESSADGLVVVRALLAEPVVQQINRLEPETGSWLVTYAHNVTAALAFAKSNRWSDPANENDVVAIMRYCLKSDAALGKICDEIHAEYACSRDHSLDVIFKKPAQNHTELVIVAWTGAEPKRFGYMTHLEWNTELYKVLSEQARKLAAAIMWVDFGRALRAGPLVFAHWKFAVSAGAVLGAAMLGRGEWPTAVVMTGFFLALALLIKWGWFQLHRKKLASVLPEDRAWLFNDGVLRCRAEAQAALGAGAVPTGKELHAKLHKVNGEVGQLKLNWRVSNIEPPLHFSGTWVAVVLSWLLLSATMAGVVAQWLGHPLSLPKFSLARSVEGAHGDDSQANLPAPSHSAQEKVAVAPSGPAESAADVAAAVAAMRKSEEEAAKKKLPPPPKIAWSFKAPEFAQKVNVRAKTEATREQLAAAEELAALTLARFDPATIHAVVAMRVPTESGTGLMLYDGKSGKFADHSVYQINFVPFARTWLEIDGRMVFYLGVK